MSQLARPVLLLSWTHTVVLTVCFGVLAYVINVFLGDVGRSMTLAFSVFPITAIVVAYRREDNAALATAMLIFVIWTINTVFWYLEPAAVIHTLLMDMASIPLFLYRFHQRGVATTAAIMVGLGVLKLFMPGNLWLTVAMNIAFVLQCGVIQRPVSANHDMHPNEARTAQQLVIDWRKAS